MAFVFITQDINTTFKSYRLKTTLYLDSISAGLKSNSKRFVNVISLKSKWFGIIPTGLVMLESFMVLTSPTSRGNTKRLKPKNELEITKPIIGEINFVKCSDSRATK